jgi:uncharacterized protein (DUF362 family)
MKEKEKVAIVRCKSYKQKEVDSAIAQALKLIDFKFEKGKTVLIKPNVVGCFPKNQIAITTNPSLIEAVCKILKKEGCKIFIGDSPFTNPETAFIKSGISKVAKKYGKMLIFEQEKMIKIIDRKAKFLREFEIPKIIKDADLVINMPKLKTHTLTKYTGAIKNLYGTIPGGLKQRLHNEARGEKKFSKLLVDIYQNIKPELTIMDAVIGMDREGPTAGKQRKVEFIIASKNGAALDIIATKMIELKPKKVYAIREAVKRKLASYNIEVVGVKKIPKINFRKPSPQQMSKSRALIRRLFVERPIIVDEAKCARCGMCAKHCPGRAITLEPYPRFNRKKCIRCFCCIEICPKHALSLKK